MDNNNKFEQRCVCCGKVFTSDDYEQDSCLECICELAEFLSIKEKPTNTYYEYFE